MLIQVIPIGNSRGIRIPKKIIEQCHIEKQVDLLVEKDRIILKPVHKRPRQNWRQQFTDMHNSGDDTLLIDESVHSTGLDWEW